MYNNYTPLQQRQLALQEYSNTQSTYLLVCASARSTALKATLTDQLHRKFRLVDRLDGELTASVDGVLLAAEDVELYLKQGYRVVVLAGDLRRASGGRGGF